MLRLVLSTILFVALSIGGIARGTHDQVPMCQPDDWGWFVVSSEPGPDIVFLTSKKPREGQEPDYRYILCALHPDTHLLVLPPSKDVKHVPEDQQKSGIPVSIR